MVKPREIIVIEQQGRVAVEQGYERDGVSMYSHASTKQAQANHEFTDHNPNPQIQSGSKLDKLIKHEAAVVARLERRAAEARTLFGDIANATAAQRSGFLGICSRLSKTRILLTRLRAEQQRAVIP
jgi:hypothetical protein